MKPSEITRESMQALAKRVAGPSKLLGWQVQDRLNALPNLLPHPGTKLPVMGETLYMDATMEQRIYGVRGIMLRKISARYWLRVVIG